VFRLVSWDEFVTNSARLEEWTQSSSDQLPLIELLREAVDLKKLNNNLMKVTMFEDLIADIYSHLYKMYIPRFLDQAKDEHRERMKVDHLLMAPDSAPESGTQSQSVPTTDAPPPRGRTKGIARRDIQRRADSIVTKSLVSRGGTTGASTAAIVDSGHKTNGEIAVEGHGQESSLITAKITGDSDNPRAFPAGRSTTLKQDMTEEAQDGGTLGAPGSVPASLHDSADDESELSEIDEQLAMLKDDDSQKPASALLLFPNLLSRKSPDPESELSIQDSSLDGDGDVNEGNEQDNGNEGETELEPGGEDAEIEVDEGDGDGDDAGDETGDIDMEDTEAPAEEEEEEEEGGEEGDEGGVDDLEDDQQVEESPDQGEEEDGEEDQDASDEQEEKDLDGASQIEADNVMDSKE
jgi:hypothetical protein